MANQAGCRAPSRGWTLFVALAAALICRSAAAEELGLRAASGFQVTLYADDDLAHDIHSMTVDSFGRVVVSGAGYVKILIDKDNDGKADSAQTFTNDLTTGAQGMFFHGRDLLCAGGEGLIRYRDQNGDDRADGPADVFLKVHAGNEHDIHAIRKGPDGWWYVISGNMAGVNANYASLPSSPVKQPQGGTILRLKPDLSQGEVYAHGFRNAYDFDFSSAGELFSFDSDDEPEISLPWYRQTRVFHVLPGSHQGWVSQGWKRPDFFFDMSPVVAACGRSSPTGVVCYQHTAFPAAYRGAVFIADWTYGRVMALPLQQAGGSWTSKPVEFLTATGQHGFAPTDMEVGKNGELYICIGGRGTRGGVYRITPVGQPDSAPVVPPVATAPQTAQLDFCLRAPQPLSSWSRRNWEPLAASLNGEVFLKAAIDRRRPEAERARAIEILTEKFNGLNGDMLTFLAADPSPLVRARAAWSVGRTQASKPNPRFVAPLLMDKDSLVQRCALESLMGADDATLLELAEPLGHVLGNPDRVVRQTAMRVLTHCEDLTLRNIAELGYKSGWQAAIPVAGAYALKGNDYAPYSIEVALRILQAKHPPALKLEAARILQLGLGDVAPTAGVLPAVFDSYAPRLNLTSRERELDKLRITLDTVYPSGHPDVDMELERVMAMVQPANAGLLAEVLSQITPSSSPVDDVHRLIVISRIPVAPTGEQRDRIAGALVQLEMKIHRGKLRQDSNYSDRILELYQALSRQDPQVPAAVLARPEFGLPGHVQFVAAMSPEQFQTAIGAFVRQIQSHPDFEWNADVVFLLGESTEEAHKDLMRTRYSDPSLRDVVLSSLATHPQVKDRKLLSEGILTAGLEMVQVCVEGLAQLPPTQDAMENAILARTLRNLGNEQEERVVESQIIEMLRRNLQLDLGYSASQSRTEQAAAVSKWVAAVQQRFPKEFASVAGSQQEDAAQMASRLAAVKWQTGNASRGAQLFSSRGCVQCHGEHRALGPDLAGVTGRFSREDLFTAILIPDRDVSPRYQTIQVSTLAGQVYTGLVVYETVEGIVLRDAANRTYRIEAEEIEIKQPVKQSLMPSGLLRGLNEQDYADLYAYLQGLGRENTALVPAAPAR